MKAATQNKNRKKYRIEARNDYAVQCVLAVGCRDSLQVQLPGPSGRQASRQVEKVTARAAIILLDADCIIAVNHLNAGEMRNQFT